MYRNAFDIQLQVTQNLFFPCLEILKQSLVLWYFYLRMNCSPNGLPVHWPVRNAIYPESPNVAIRNMMQCEADDSLLFMLFSKCIRWKFEKCTIDKNAIQTCKETFKALIQMVMDFVTSVKNPYPIRTQSHTNTHSYTSNINSFSDAYMR